MSNLDRVTTLFSSVYPGAYQTYSAVVEDRAEYVSSVVVCPDVHGRPELVQAALDSGADRVLFVGDIIHREQADSWRRMDRMFSDGQIQDSKEFQEEVVANLTCWELILQAKKENPLRVHFVRGNHDDTEGFLMGSYGKYARINLESRIWRDGLAALNKQCYNAMIAFERKIPYVYRGLFTHGKETPDILVTHSLPHSPHWTRAPKLNHPDTHETYSWSDNTYHNAAWEEYTDSIDVLMKQHFNADWDSLDHWFIGHRSVRDGLARVQHGGKVVQINNPDEMLLLHYSPKKESDKWEVRKV